MFHAFAAQAAQGGATSGADSSTGTVNFGAFAPPSWPGKAAPGFDLSRPQDAILVGAAVLLFGAVMLKAVKKKGR